MESKIIKAFFDGTLSDEMIKSPRTKEYKEIDELYSEAITKKIARKIFRKEKQQRGNISMCRKAHCSRRILP